MNKSIIFTLLISLLLTVKIKAQSNENNDSTCNSSVSVNVDFMNRYIWRAIDFGNTPSIQPSITYSYKNFSLGAWSSCSTNGDFAEIDLFTSYSIGNFTVMLTDFFYPYDSLTTNNSFFNLKNASTGHTIEAGLKYTNKIIPVSLGIYSFIYGYDPKPFSNDKYYSTYIELAYNFSIKDTDLELVAGFTPMESYYASKFNLINVGFTGKKNIKITPEFSLPIKASLITNPVQENIYLTFGISL